MPLFMRAIGNPISDVQSRIDAAQTVFHPFASIAGKDDPAWQGGTGPLAGVATSVKDILDVAGFATRRGSRLLADAPLAQKDIEAVARLRAAGAAIVAKSTTTEFAHSPLGSSPADGMTRNPWNPERTCGGSSSGAGVAVATGATPVSLATDAGCSTRLPAALTGVLGLKPTIGRIPHEGLPECFANIVHLGVLAASADLLERAMKAVAGPQRDDAMSLGHGPLAGAEDSIGGSKALLWMTVGNQAVHPIVETQIHIAVERLAQLGVTVWEGAFTLPNPTQAFEVLQQVGWADRFASLPADRRALLSPSFNAGIDAGTALGAGDLLRALAARTAAFRAVQAVFAQGHDFILTPCTSAPAVTADHPVDAPLEIGGRSVGSLRAEWIPYLSLFDLSGHPALALPIGFDESGVPMAIQLVAPWGREDRLLAAARAWEAAWSLPRLTDGWLTR